MNAQAELEQRIRKLELRQRVSPSRENTRVFSRDALPTPEDNNEEWERIFLGYVGVLPKHRACIHGHVYTKDTIYHAPDGRPRCRTCQQQRESQREPRIRLFSPDARSLRRKSRGSAFPGEKPRPEKCVRGHDLTLPGNRGIDTRGYSYCGPCTTERKRREYRKRHNVDPLARIEAYLEQHP